MTSASERRARKRARKEAKAGGSTAANSGSDVNVPAAATVAQLSSPLMPIVFLKSVPDGFYEDQMRDYFTQFGTVRNVRLWRSKKTGKSKGIAWVEFVDMNAASVAAQTMDNYLVFGHLMKCCLLRAAQVPPQLFERRFARPPRPHVASERAARNQNTAAPSTLARQRKRHNRTVKTRTQKLAALGIVYGDDDVVKKADSDDDVKIEDTPPTRSGINSLSSYRSSSAHDDDDDDDYTTAVEDCFTGPYLLEVDSSCTDVSFNTPPNSVRVRKVKSRNVLKSADSQMTATPTAPSVKRTRLSRL